MFFAPRPSLVFAAEKTCNCYCGVEKEGAVRFPIGADQTKLTVNACQATCKAGGYNIVTCAMTSDQLPSQNVSCFNQDQCTKQKGTFDSKYQPLECTKGMRYCYPDESKQEGVALQVSIGGLTTTKDLGEYIATAYNWMIGTATLIAIVLIMVGGLQWSFSAVSAEMLGKAKKRMMNGVIGLVLLLSTYLILQTVNPQLLSLQVPDFPMIRQVSLLDGDDSCGYLTGKWGTAAYWTKFGAPSDSPYSQNQPPPKSGKSYTIEEPSNGTACGSVAQVTKDWEGKDIPEGTTCTYTYCPNTRRNGERCFVSSTGGQCLACGQLINKNAYLTPSSSVCSSLSFTGFKNYGDRGKVINECFWTRDGSFIPAVSSVSDLLSGDGTCALLNIDCSQIETCEDYDTVATVSNDSASGQLESVQYSGAQPPSSITWGDSSLTSVCNEDPCEVAQREGNEGTRCYSDFLGVGITSILTGNDCVTLWP